MSVHSNIRIILFIPALIIACSFFSQSMAQSSGGIEVKLQKEYYPADNRWGLYNIFFDDLGDIPAKYPSGWMNVQIGRIVMKEDLKPVYIIKYDDSSNSSNYVVDTNADLDFFTEVPLHFNSNGKVKIADTRIKIIKKDNTPVNELNYQILLADEYSYAIVSEFRRGELTLNGKTIKILLRLERGNPVFTTSDNTLFFADLNNDGIITEKPKVDQNGKVIMSEKLSLSNPFLMDGRKYEAVYLSGDGMNLTLQPSAKDTACFVGSYLPAVTGKDKAGGFVNLKNYKGKKVLIQFWSTGCPHSEGIRESINNLIDKSGSRFVSVNIPEETDVEEVNKYLAEHPSKSLFLYTDDGIKNRLNPNASTPLFYMIDESGKIVFKESGCDCIEVIEKLLN